MNTVHFWEFICFTSIHIVLCITQHSNSPQADVIKHCENSTNSTNCINNYEQLYKNLTKAENSFNISYALYPGKRKPSFLVKVNVYGPKKTDMSTPAMYTWSIHCLYATVPGRLLEVLSLWSIFVTSRSEELNIQIPPVCCNVSDDEKKREEIIQGFLTRAITELQDLAVSPGIRDPSLNTATCIRQGHKPTMDLGGPSAYIRAMLWCSLVFVFFSGSLLAKYIKENWNLQNENKISIEEKNTANAVCFSFNILAVVGYFILIVAFGLSCFYLHRDPATFDIFIILLAIFVLSVGLSIYVTVKYCTPPYPDYNMNSRCQKCFLWIKKRFLKVYFLICGANVISYLFCWLIIGITINPTWGLTIVLLVISVSAAVTYARYLHLVATNTTYSNAASNTTSITSSIASITSTPSNTTGSSHAANNTTGSSHAASTDVDRMVTNFFCVSGCLAVLFLFVIIVLSGQSYTGNEMAADELLKTTSLYFISAFISWVTWKKHQQSGEKTQSTSNSAPPNPEGAEGNRPGRNQETTV